MDSLNLIIVDDEPGARELLVYLVQSANMNIVILDQCENVMQAVKSIKKHEPDAILLDVRMPEFPGYDLVNFFEDITFDIVFVTAYDEYAIKAFELSAVDYLVKPVDRKRLHDTLQKLIDRKQNRDVVENYETLIEMIKDQELGKIVISELEGGQLTKRVLHLDQIIAAEAMGAYCKIYLLEESPIMLSRNLKHFLGRLPKESPFFRSHRSWMVNQNHIIKYQPRSGELMMQKDLVAKVSKNCEADLQKLGF